MSKLDIQRVIGAFSAMRIYGIKPDSKDVPMIHILEGIKDTHRLISDKNDNVKELEKKLRKKEEEAAQLAVTLVEFEEVLNKVYSEQVIEEFLTHIEKEEERLNLQFKEERERRKETGI